MKNQKIYTGLILDETTTLTLQEICITCNVHAELIIEMVDQGLLEPSGASPEEWQFSSTDLPRSRMALHLKEDLGVNLPGIALALDLLEELRELRSKIALLEQQQKF